MNYSKLFALQIVGLLLLLNFSIPAALAQEAPREVSQDEQLVESSEASTSDTETSATTEATSTISQELQAEEEQVEPIGEEELGEDSMMMSTGGSSLVPGQESLSPETPVKLNGYYETSMFTGSASYVYPLQVPPGTNGLAPQLSLEYSSHASNDDGWVGSGWSFAKNYIERDINNTVNTTADDEYALYLNNNRYDLVYVESDGRYHTNPETYLYIENLSGAGNENGIYWRVRTKDGTSYRFGYKNESETLRGIPGKHKDKQATESLAVSEGYHLCRGCTKCSERDWTTVSSNRVLDVEAVSTYCGWGSGHGYCTFDADIQSQNHVHLTVCITNQMWYDYCNDHSSECYASATFRIDYQQPNNTITDIASRWSLDQVEDVHGNIINFSYVENPGTDENGSVYLSEIRYNSEGSRHISFALEDKPVSWDRYVEGAKVVESQRLKEINMSVDGDLVRRFVLNYSSNPAETKSWLTSITMYGSDGVSSLPSTEFTYQESLSNWTHDASWDPPCNLKSADGCRYVDLDADGLVDVLKATSSTRTAWVNNGSGWMEDASFAPPSGVRFDGDQVWGSIDVNTDGKSDLLGSTIYLNNGSGWGEDSSWYIPCTFSGGSACRFIDVNGDGRIDAVRALYQGTHKSWINTGSNFSLDTSWGLDVGVRFDGNTQWGVMDFNHDGNVDVVNPDTDVLIKNNGAGFYWTGSEDYDIPCGFESGDGCRYVDVNGDGLTDIVQATDSTHQTWVFNGTGWELDGNSTPPSDVRFDGDQGWGALDVNGDGLSDLINGSKVYLHNGYAPERLIIVKNGFGGETSINYTPSTQYSNTNLAYPLWVVNATTLDNGQNLDASQRRKDTYTFKYWQGKHEYDDEEFRGFGEVRKYWPDGNITAKFFLQADATKGLLDRYYIERLDVGPYYVFIGEDNWWTVTTTNGVSTVVLDEQYTYIQDGTEWNHFYSGNTTEVSYEYDEYGNPTKITHWGLVSYFNTDIAGDEKYEEFAYTYNVGDWVVDMPAYRLLKDGNQITVEGSYFLYDHHYNLFDPPTHGEVTKRVDLNDGYTDPVTEYDYDEYGNVVWEKDPNNRVTTYAYDSATHTFPVSETNALGHVTQRAYDVGLGKVLNVTDANGYVTKYVYDVFGRKVKEIRPLDSLSSPTVEFEYLDSQFPRGVVTMRRDGAASTLDSYVFRDGFGRTVQSRSDAEDAGLQVVVNTFYDGLGRVQAESVPHFDGYSSTYASPVLSTRNTSFEYDPLDRQTRVTNPDGSFKSFAYLHLVVNATDENGHLKQFFKDAYARIIEVKEHNLGDVYNTTYGYDAQDNLVSITDNEDNEFLFEYDALGRKTKLVDPDLGNWSYGYDAVGNLVSQTDNRGWSTSFTYDDLNRVTKVDYENDTDVSYAYDGIVGTLTQVNNSAGETLNYVYDKRLRLIGEEKEIDSFSLVRNWSYDSMDRVTQVKLPDGSMIDYSYNGMGLLESVSDAITDFNYTALGKVSDKAYANGKHTSYTYYDDDFRLQNIYTGGVQNLSYVYDDVGNVKEITSVGVGDDFTQTFAYDDLDRLTQANESGNFSYTYAYSSIGNLVNVTEDGLTIYYRYSGVQPHAVTSLDGCSGSSPPESGNWTIEANTECGKSALGVANIEVQSGKELGLTRSVLHVDGTIHLAGGNISLKDSTVGLADSNDFEYDENGNLQTDGSFWYVYNDANQLYEVREGSAGGDLVSRYLYNHEGRRTVKKEYSGGDLVNVTYYVGRDYEVQNYSGSTHHVAYFMANGELAAKNDSGTKTYYHNDHLTGTNLVTDEAGLIEERTRYYPFGSVLKGGDSKYTYTGQESDKETGLMYYGARYYKPELRRFVQPDTIIQDFYDPQTLNRYSYTRNNPEKHIDSGGNIFFVPFLVAVGLGVAAEVVYGMTHGEDGSQWGMVAYGVAGATAPLVATGASGAAGAVGVGEGASAVVGAVFANVFQSSVEKGVDGEQYTSDDLTKDVVEGVVAYGFGRGIDKATGAFRPRSLGQSYYFLQKTPQSLSSVSANSGKLVTSDLYSEWGSQYFSSLGYSNPSSRGQSYYSPISYSSSSNGGYSTMDYSNNYANTYGGGSSYDYSSYSSNPYSNSPFNSYDDENQVCWAR